VALIGGHAAEYVREVLRGEYGEQGDGQRRGMELRWNATQTGAVGGFAEMSDVLEWIRSGGGE
jgi:hypothetical protein